MYCDKQKAALFGKTGEDKVAQFLRRRGYIIIKRNWRDKRYGEIDIIAENDDYIVFVEVKTRAAHSIVSGAEAVDYGKMHRIRNAAAMFMKRLNSEKEIRIDVAEVIVYTSGDGSNKWELKYIKSAF